MVHWFLIPTAFFFEGLKFPGSCRLGSNPAQHNQNQPKQLHQSMWWQAYRRNWTHTPFASTKFYGWYGQSLPSTPKHTLYLKDPKSHHMPSLVANGEWEKRKAWQSKNEVQLPRSFDHGTGNAVHGHLGAPRGNDWHPWNKANRSKSGSSGSKRIERSREKKNTRHHVPSCRFVWYEQIYHIKYQIIQYFSNFLKDSTHQCTTGGTKDLNSKGQNSKSALI